MRNPAADPPEQPLQPGQAPARAIPQPGVDRLSVSALGETPLDRALSATPTHAVRAIELPAADSPHATTQILLPRRSAKGWLTFGAAAVVALLVAGSLAGLHGLRQTQARLAQTEQRLRTAEGLINQSAALRNAERSRRLASETALLEQVIELRTQQVTLLQAGTSLRNELGGLQQHTRDQLASLARQTEDLSTRAPLTGLFATAREAVLYIRTEYEVEIPSLGRSNTFTVFGTGFVVSPEGLAVTAQHVLRPWEFDPQVRVLEKAGRIRALPHTVRYTVWLTDERVLRGETDADSYFTARSYRSGPGLRGMRVLHRAPVVKEDRRMNTAYGEMTVQVPRMGPSDIAVFQLQGSQRHFAHLTVSRSTPGPQALHEVLLIGYPLSRLEDGVAAPQPVLGQVRRLSSTLLELNSPIQQGISGGPVLDGQGRVIGMASAMLDSPVYGVAVRGQDLAEAIAAARAVIADEQRQFAQVGCYEGPVDGVAGPRTLAAQRCAMQQGVILP